MIKVLKYTEELEKVGFTTEQAKTSVELWGDLMDQNFATKADLEKHYLMTKNDMKELRTELQIEINKINSSIEGLQDKMTIRLGSLMTIGIAILAAFNYFKN